MPDNHTPTPWYAWLPKGVSTGCRTIRTVEGRTHGGYSGTEIAGTVGRMDDDVDKANAALIVRAVNRDHLFGELVEALDKCVGALMGQGLLKEGYHETVCAEVRDILAKVKEAGHG